MSTIIPNNAIIQYNTISNNNTIINNKTKQNKTNIHKIVALHRHKNQLISTLNKTVLHNTGKIHNNTK